MNAAPIFSARFARAYAITGRPYLCFVSGATGLAGLAGIGAVVFGGYVYLYM